METAVEYRDVIRTLLTKYGSYGYRYGDVETHVIFDAEHDHYQLLRMGWEGKQRVYGCVFHLNIRDGKIWIQMNSSDIDIGQELVEMGIPKDKIVLGFHPEGMRQYSEYAVS